jgi:hypothetical protein
MEYDSGPFCRHWGDPSDCEEICTTCGHICTRHAWYAPSECNEEGCSCVEYVDEDHEAGQGGH